MQFFINCLYSTQLDKNKGYSRNKFSLMLLLRNCMRLFWPSCRTIFHLFDFVFLIGLPLCLLDFFFGLCLLLLFSLFSLEFVFSFWNFSFSFWLCLYFFGLFFQLVFHVCWYWLYVVWGLAMTTWNYLFMRVYKQWLNSQPSLILQSTIKPTTGINFKSNNLFFVFKL